MTKRRNLSKLLLILSLFGFVLSACSEAPAPSKDVLMEQARKQEAKTIKDTAPELLPVLQQEITQTWKDLVESAQALNEQTKQFTRSPSEGNLEALNTIWEQTHSQYSATRAYTFLQLPPPPVDIDQDSERSLHKLEIRLDQQPLIPGYLDAVQGYPRSGLIYSEIPITENSLENEHQLGDIAYVAMGFHALEFLLEGDKNLNLNLKDRFGDGENKKETTDITRRKQYSELLSALILKDLQQLQAVWTTPDGHFYQALRLLPSEKRHHRITKFLQREQAVINELTERPVEHIDADVISLRKERLAKLQALITQASSEGAEPE